jgi:hypothetical protein
VINTQRAEQEGSAQTEHSSDIIGIYMKKIAFALGLSALVFAGVAAAAGPWSNSVVVSGIEADSVSPGSGTATYLSFTTTPTGKPSCGTANQYLLTGSADHVRSATSLATTALLTGRSVKVYWDGGCDGTFAKVVAIQLF